MVVMAAATSMITEQSPFVVRAELHAAAGDEPARQLGLAGRHQEGRDARDRLRSGHRRRDHVQEPVHRAGRAGARRAARAAAQSGFRAVPAARARRLARRRVRVRAVGRRRDLHEAVRRARARQERHQAHRHRRRHRRRHPERHGRRRAGRDHLVPLLGRARLADEQGVRRGVQEAQRHAAQLHVDGRLRRHAPHLQGARGDQGQHQRRGAASTR